MFAIGHFALGYLTGKSVSMLLNVKLNLPLLFVASVIPDIDLILQYVDPALFMHRGSLHSIITYTLFMLPFFIRYRKQAAPYYVALLSHSLLGDLYTGGFQMLWPISQRWFGVLSLDVRSLANISLEIMLLLISLAIMIKTKDLLSFFKPNNHNLFLFIAFGATLGPMLDLSPNFEGSLPMQLIIPSLFWMLIFVYSMIIELYTKLSLISLR